MQSCLWHGLQRTFSDASGHFRRQQGAQEVQLLVLLLLLQLRDSCRHVDINSTDAAARQGRQVDHGLQHRKQHTCAP
jgi:hypothetical protein